MTTTSPTPLTTVSWPPAPDNIRILRGTPQICDYSASILHPSLHSWSITTSGAISAARRRMNLSISLGGDWWYGFFLEFSIFYSHCFTRLLRMNFSIKDPNFNNFLRMIYL